MKTYYIDFTLGQDKNDGLSPEKPRKNYTDLPLSSGDRVLFRRGNFVRGMLEAVKNVSYGAYGEGELPTFCGSIDVSEPSTWLPTEDTNIWKCAESFCGDIGNLIFNINECTATLRWTKEELCEQGDFYSCPIDPIQAKKDLQSPHELYFYSIT